MKTVIVVQARMGSSRLPGKVMKPLAGEPLLQRQVERILCTRHDVDVMVATTTELSDEPIRELCKGEGFRCYSGHPTDLLDRHVKAAQLLDADQVVKIPSDCPLIDPDAIDRVLDAAERDPELDYVSNLHPPTWPDGNDVEVMKRELLELAWNEARLGWEREHTTPFFWDRPERFSIGNVRFPGGRDLSMTHRWTVDYQADLEFVQAVYSELWSPNYTFSTAQILQLLADKPAIARINRHLAGVNWYRHHLDELRTVDAEQTRNEPIPDTANSGSTTVVTGSGHFLKAPQEGRA